MIFASPAFFSSIGLGSVDSCQSFVAKEVGHVHPAIQMAALDPNRRIGGYGQLPYSSPLTRTTVQPDCRRKKIPCWSPTAINVLSSRLPVSARLSLPTTTVVLPFPSSAIAPLTSPTTTAVLSPSVAIAPLSFPTATAVVLSPSAADAPLSWPIETALEAMSESHTAEPLWYTSTPLPLTHTFGATLAATAPTTSITTANTVLGRNLLRTFMIFLYS